jgi:hypothetical protein
MAVDVVAQHPDGSVTVVHRVYGHTGTIPAEGVAWGRSEDGTVNPDYILLACPVCGAESLHPVSGGSQPFEHQKLFVRTSAPRADELGIPVAERSFAQIRERVRQRIAALDGPARSAIDHMQHEDDGPARLI